ncbi:MAG TPA: metallophosphoesterase family protein, partial [Planctomycetaceae bacterium]|nr:metallophosphoesterase family protein [Planctomycetaceae bacterium]
LGYPPFCWQSRDGVKFLLAHQQEDVKGLIDGSDVIVFAHTHRPSIATDRHGRVFINPGEVGGWFFRRPTVAVFDTETRTAEIMDLPPMPPAVMLEER